MRRVGFWLALIARGAAWTAPLTGRRGAACPTMAASAKELVIWDCDGVLVDSEALLKTSEVEALAAAGFTDVTRDDCNRLFSGYAPEAGAKNFLAEYGKPLPENFFRDQIDGSADLFRRRLTQLNAETVLALHAAGRKQVVASGSPRDRVIVCLEVAGIDGCFAPEEIFTREDVPGRGKPEPDMFLLAAEKMGVAPSACVVVEDSTAGVRAAQAAEMEVVGYVGGGHATAEWYRERLSALEIPLVTTDTELLDYLRFTVDSGPCRTSGSAAGQDYHDCVQSGNYPSQYSALEHCEISVDPAAGNIYSARFETENNFDKLRINGQVFDGNTGPDDLPAVGPIVWDSDMTLQKSGWKICAAPAPP